MKSRIEEFLKAENKTSAQLAEEIGVQPSGISHILSGRNKPSLDFVLKMLERYPFISTEWLLFGKGNMYREASMQSLFEESQNNTSEKKDIENQNNNISEIRKTDEEKDNEVDRKKGRLIIEKIVWFYSDNSFREFTPGEN
jgi:transcriptional regulator with XRE-family HTH domain